MSKKLWYRKPADRWVEGLPLGNGTLGAMVLGRIFNERIALNEDTLWTGIPKDKTNYKSKNYLDRVRELINNEDYYEAQEIINNEMLSGYTESYSPLGNLYLDFYYEDDECLNYTRELDLDKALVTVKYNIGNIEIKRETFISAKDKVLVMKITSDKKKSLNFDVRLNSLLNSNIYKDEKGLILKGIAPIELLPSYVNNEDIIYDKNGEQGTKFCTRIRVNNVDGKIDINEEIIRIRNSSEVILLLSASTNFEEFNIKQGSSGRNEEALSKIIIDKASYLSYEKLFNNHLKEYSELFTRVEFNLEEEVNKEAIPTDERLEGLKSGEEDLDLVTLYFHYGRYLLISSSRSGSEPANLQGIWNEEIRPPWSSNYTININTEMNYWPAEVCNLSECHEPLLNMIKDLSISGRKTAKEEFNCEGWTANHNVDIWRYSRTVRGSCEWGYWPMGGPWLTQHIWEHYDFTRDNEFLKEYYDVLKESANFLLSWLKEDSDGVLNTIPSTSPENNFLDHKRRACAASKSSTMDISIARDLFTNIIKASEELEIDLEFREKIKSALDKLPKYKINKFGGIQEWFKDFEEKEPGHRHISHLFGLYPGKEITEYKNKDLLEACKNTLSRRLSQGGGHTGWSCAWIINFYARLKDSDLSYKYLKTLLNKLTYPNLFCVHPPFQIDGNFGGTAGIAEMLIQSHTDYIEILPSIPKAWKCGQVKGLKARGGFTIDISWKDSRLISIKIKSKAEGICNVKYRRYLEDYSTIEEKRIFLSRKEEKIINL
ncbi:MAG: glycoside hydrolase family 95 protein [Clostridium sartagoforme]|nr:glycoside hydrolase family 95 protein [Clostridium sartagoforme]